MPMNSNILTLLHFARQQELTLVAELKDVERNAIGTPGAWAAKDFLANIMRWKELHTQKLAAAKRGDVPPSWRGMDEIHQVNSQTFTAYQTHTFEEIEQESEQIFNAFIAQVEAMSEEELNDPHYYPWQEGERLRGGVLNYGLFSPCEQLTTFSLQQGHRQFAFQLQESLVEVVRASGLPAEGVGVTIYNLACFYAKNGLPEKALSLLPEALKRRPTLLEWSRRDSDLASLHSNPAFQALFNDPVLLSQVPVSELILPQDLYASMSKDAPPFVIDVRGSAEYAAGHIAGAINIPLGQLESKLAQIPQDRLVVTYCNMHHPIESRGEKAAAQLRGKGYQVQTLSDGYPNWEAQGLPVEEAPQKHPVYIQERITDAN
nr:rhodanese-like domain-containing protein [Ktedonobacter sp. SOSP1-85]